MAGGKLPARKGGAYFVPPEGPIRFGYASGPGTTDHGALTGLADDDHTQYLTQAAADALYEAAGVVSAHEAAGDPHSGYMTAAEVSSGYQPLDADLTTIAAGITSAGHALLDDADAPAQRATLGLGALATVTPTGTPDGTKYLRDDNSWQAVTGGSGLTQPQVMARGLGA